MHQEKHQERSAFLENERLLPLLLRMSVPLMVGMVVNALYNAVDTVFVGQGVGPLAIAALAIAFPIQMLFGGLAQAIGVGAASIVSRRLGERKPEEAAHATGTAFAIVAGTSAVAAGILCACAEPLLALFGATEATMPYARVYLRVIASGVFFLGFSMACGALTRAEGRAAVAMVGMVLGALINVALDPLLIFGLHMGVAGAAVATVASQACSFAYFAAFYVRRRGQIHLARRHLVPNVRLAGEALALGFPSIVMHMGMSLVAILINGSLLRYGGDLAISTYGMLHRLFGLVIMPLMGLVQGAQPILGYNLGAGRYERVRGALKVAGLAAVVVSSASVVLVQSMPRTLIGLFTSDQELAARSARALRIFFSCAPIVGIQMLGGVYYQAVGKPVPALLLSLSRQFIILIPVVAILPRLLGLDGVWMSFPVADAISVAVTSVALSRELALLGRQEREREPAAVRGSGAS